MGEIQLHGPSQIFLYNNIWEWEHYQLTQCIYGNGPTTASFGWRWNWPDGGNPTASRRIRK